MNNSILQDTIQRLNIPAFVEHANNATLVRILASMPNEDAFQPTPEKLPRYGLLYEKQGIDLFKRAAANEDGVTREQVQDCFQSAYTCWRTLLFLSDDPQSAVNGHVSSYGLSLVEQDLADGMLLPELVLAFRLAASGLLSGRIAETRLDLERFPLASGNTEGNWQDTVVWNLFSAFVLLVRKAHGWRDVRQALQNIHLLQELQKEYEETYLENLEDPDQQTAAAVTLVSFYHLARLITLVGDYLRTGQPGYDAVITRLNMHYDHAVEALEVAQQPFLAHLADLLWAGCRELTQNAIWTHVSRRQGENVWKYVELLTATNREQPVIELWPSQQEAFQQHLLDPYQRSVLIEMPTSAGKTLLAKFMIAQTKTLYPDGLVAYIVPTRTLVNQVTLDLRSDFRQLFRVEQAVPAFELDPTEERLLADSRIDILVVTPEKLDLLVRSNHPITRKVSLIIADEAHNINDGERGARLECLLGTMKRDFPDAAFLLLSPFLPNPDDFVQWLGGKKSLAPIRVDWKPNQKLVGVLQSVRRRNLRNIPRERRWLLEFETFASVHSPGIRGGMKIPLAYTPARLATDYSLSLRAASALQQRGTVLILCKGPSTAMKRAQQVSSERSQRPSNPTIEAVCHYIEAELGGHCDLTTYLRHGVAYHHGGLSQEARWLIEDLIGAGLIDVVCGTTTLAQGVNFPITTVIIESFVKGIGDRLTYQDFWNIAGRAGRALVDIMGVIAFPTSNAQKRQQFADFLQKESRAVVSQLAELFMSMEDIQFTLNYLLRNPQLSPLLQFLAHAMRVSGSDNLADEVEELLRSSLVYYQVNKENRQAAQHLIAICRKYLQETYQHRQILPLADKTGFSTPSVLSLLESKSADRELASPDNWQPSRLFGKDIGPLAERIEAVAELPEIRLGEATFGKFGTRTIAAILRDWVNGLSLQEMARIHWLSDQSGEEQDIGDATTEFSRHLYRLIGRASWGIGALETVALGGNERVDWSEIGYIPSMIYFGVRQKEAIFLRMVGVPRVFASQLAILWRNRKRSEPSDYSAIRGWLSDFSQSDWQAVIPANSPLTPKDMQIIWQSFSGGI